MKKIIRVFPGRCGTAVGLMWLAGMVSAWAHAFLNHADPKVGSEVAQSPTEVRLWFTQALEPAFSTLTVADAQGQEMDKKDAHLDAKDATLLMVSVPTLAAGTYTVNWQVVSTDTHKTQGSFKFTVKPTSTK
jgi:copper resistance protein C